MAPAAAASAVTAAGVAPRPDGAGLAVVVNPSARAAGADLADVIRAALPAATVDVLDEGASLTNALAAHRGATVLGIVGGDGSVGAAATVALDTGRPLAVFPGGTLNHCARDLGLATVDDTVEAIRAGSAGEMDVGLVDGHVFLNTASFGSYAALVDRRERLEPFVGKWVAMAIALVQVLVRERPVDVSIDGVRRRVHLIFIGNGEYEPDGLAPRRRPRLDDGLLDVRIVEAQGHLGRLRVLVAWATGRLATCPTYERMLVPARRVESHDGALRLAADGETFDGAASFMVTKHPRRLSVHVAVADAGARPPASRR